MAFDPASLKYDDRGLIPGNRAGCTGNETVLMMAWMNAAIANPHLGQWACGLLVPVPATFWVKGETSGHIKKLVEFSRRLRPRLPFGDCESDRTPPAIQNREGTVFTAVKNLTEKSLDWSAPSTGSPYFSKANHPANVLWCRTIGAVSSQWRAHRRVSPNGCQRHL